MDNLFSAWNSDSSKTRQSVLFENSGISDTTSKNLIETWFNATPVSSPSSNEVSNNSFWDKMTG